MARHRPFAAKSGRVLVAWSFFLGIGIAVELIWVTEVSGVVIGAVIQVGIGVIILVKALFFSEAKLRSSVKVINNAPSRSKISTRKGVDARGCW